MSAALYESDFHEWTLDQARRLRGLLDTRSNIDLDLEHLADEVESMGASQRGEVESRLAIILEHLLKLSYSPNVEARNGWVNSVVTQRIDLESVLDKNPSLRRLMPDLLVTAYRRGARRAELARVSLSMDVLPSHCPFTLDAQVLSDWLPQGPFA